MGYSPQKQSVRGAAKVGNQAASTVCAAATRPASFSTNKNEFAHQNILQGANTSTRTKRAAGGTNDVKQTIAIKHCKQHVNYNNPHATCHRVAGSRTWGGTTESRNEFFVSRSAVELFAVELNYACLEVNSSVKPTRAISGPGKRELSWIRTVKKLFLTQQHVKAGSSAVFVYLASNSLA